MICTAKRQRRICLVTVGGWIRTMRVSKNFGFIELNDGTFFKNLQVVIEPDKLDNYDAVTRLPEGSAVTVAGMLTLTPGMKQPFEVKAQQVTVEGLSTADYPMQKKRHSVEYLRTQSAPAARTNLFSAVFRIRSLAAYAIHQFFQDRNFVYVHTPLITASDCEGAGEMFQVTTLDLENPPRNADGSVDYSKDFFGKKANLTVSGQLNAECAALAFRNVYTFGPTFRAENSYTPRHAAEFWMIAPEIAFADLRADMDLAQDMSNMRCAMCWSMRRRNWTF
jgi:asparaginyl-tRNA synthetase